jgi:protein-export membrane protein SecD
MQYSVWKKILVCSVLVWAVIWALPNTLNEETVAKLPDAFPKQTLNLGLDLQGGSHLVLEVDVAAVTKRAYENLEEEVRLLMRKEKHEGTRLYYRNMKAHGAMKLTFTAPRMEQVPTIKEQINDQVRNIVAVESGGDFTLTFTPEYILEMEQNALSQTLEILRARVDEFGVAEPVIQRLGDRRVIVELPGVDDVERAKSVIGRTAQLTFHMVDSSASVDSALKGNISSENEVFYEYFKDPVSGETREIPYVLKKRPVITGDHLAKATSGFDQNNEPAVFIGFDGVGTRKFAKITTEFTGHRMAIVLDGVVYSAPSLREPILGGNASITGSFTPKETKDLALVLRAGALPAPVDFVEERTVGPSLGADSIEAGKKAIVIGFIFVLIIMFLFYSGFGVAANVALLCNVVLIVAIMTALGATLTLPGIAGIVLTIGMAVDANVLIFERIREEAKVGKSVVSSMEAGFKSAFSTIVDANVTTLIAAIVLFAMGSGPIKGFALTLSVGIASSMFTAILVTRLLLTLWVNKAKPKKLTV